ncbi:hypothetical protein CROQUDRAFT_96798 [Cronartium quercuum f. sp. fusiforme G11]|uniref:Dystroglycan-type cadherin-like domain-containing protein n=1 Tax=Cronartium quercuum f. sp. fusiforme G11 TaxID=708437 RepID=A0A9P6NG28_9BASI|nr:hypothetical protein CROQUDRAFT_96798 [Cronartium quercuum f. sp. fusiforme G11]
MHTILHLLSIFSVALSTLASPSTRLAVVHPLADQRPPVARVGIPFSWSILAGTFNSSIGNSGVTYSVRNLPPWASFSSDLATIQGTPDASRLGSINVVITAHDANNSSSVSDNFNMLVVDSPPPRVKLPLATQLGNGAVLGSAKFDHATNGITVPPNWSWSIGLLPDTFVTTSGADIYYTAYEAGTTSLPSWMKFNTNTATFDGVSPNEQNEVTIVVYGSDHLGYGDVQQNFTFTITQHILDLVQPLPPINATAQSIINYTIPISNFNVDGTPRNQSTPIIESVDLSGTPYLSHDKEQHSITGTLPASLLAQTNLTIPVVFNTPSCHNNVTTQVVLRVLPGLFTAPVLPPLYVQPGQAFTLDLNQYTSNLNATYSLAHVSPPEALPWIHFTTYPLTLSGTPPNSYDTGSTPITVTLEATGLNGLHSVAELPIRFDKESDSLFSSSSNGLSDSSKLAIAIIFGSVGGIMLLILIMRNCRKYCSADGIREREEENIYHTRYAYPGEKSEMTKPSSAKQTPLSLGDTFVGTNSPKWKGDEEVGGPMMIVTPNELAMTGRAQTPQNALKRLDIFNVFTRPSRPERESSSSHPSLRGLGIVAPDHRVINVLTMSDPSQAEDEVADEEEDDDDDYDSEEVVPPANRTRRDPATSTDDQRSSWNTTGSSSLFYSDTQGEDSESPSSRSPKRTGKWLVKPSASVPRRRKDFKPVASRSLEPERQSDGVDVGTIRMVVDQGSGSYSDTNTSEDDAMALSESLGAIKTASYKKITPESLHSGPVTASEADSGSSLRPRLIAFKSQRVPSQNGAPLPRRISSSVVHGDAMEDAYEEDDENRMQTPLRRECDIGGSHRLSAHSVYTPPEPVNGSPTTSAIFFSSPRDQHWNPSSPAIPSPLSASYSAQDPQIPNQSPNPNSENFFNGPSTNPTSYPSSSSPHGQRAFSRNSGPVVVKVGVGEPFHMTPSINRPPSVQMTGSPGRKQNPVNEGNKRYFALTHFPAQPDKDRKQLPEWLHFDAREYEVWGIPGKNDIGLMPIQIISRKTVTLPGPSGRQAGNQVGITSGTHQEEVEEVVARLVLDVVDKKAAKGPGHGDVTVVTF